MCSQIRRWFWVILICAGLDGAAVHAAPRTVLIGTVGPGFPPSQIARVILIEAYARIGCQAEFQAFPPLRMFNELDNGRIDALIIAEASFAKEHPQSVQVKVPILHDELLAFSKKPLNVRSWEDLRAQRIGFIRGMLIIEQKLASGSRLNPVSGPEPLFLMLEAGRTDAVVTSGLIGQLMVRDLGLKNITPVGAVLERIPLFHFLAPKNADLAAALESALEEMRASGRTAEITRATSARLLAPR